MRFISVLISIGNPPVIIQHELDMSADNFLGQKFRFDYPPAKWPNGTPKAPGNDFRYVDPLGGSGGTPFFYVVKNCSYRFSSMDNNGWAP